MTEANSWKIDWSDRGGSFYYSELTHNAQLLYFLARHFPERIKANTAEGVMAVARSAQREHNTLSSAHSVLALDAYADAVALTTPQKLALEEILRDGTLRPLSLPAGLAPHVAFTPDAAKLRFSASGPQPAFYSVTEAGYERTPATTPLQAGMEIIREFVDANGKPVTKVKQGDELRVRVRFRSMSKRVFWDGVIVDVLPGGFEPILEDLIRAPQADQSDGRCAQTDTSEGSGEGDASSGDCEDPHAGASSGTDANSAANKGRWYAEHIDVREDRVIAFGTIGTQVSELTYRVRATTPGSFTVPAAYAESMYDPVVRARSAATRVSVEAR